MTGLLRKQSLLVAEALWSMVNGLLRIAAALLLGKLFDGTFSTSRATNYALIILSIALSMVSVGEVFLICRPFAAHWDPKILGMCGDQMISFTLLESVGLILDLVIFIIPVVRLWEIQIPRQRKAKVCLVLDAGAM